VLTPKILDALCQRDTADIVAVLRQSSTLGTEVGDIVLAHLGNYPERYTAVRRELGLDFGSAA
jgi:hypothetical protein